MGKFQPLKSLGDAFKNTVDTVVGGITNLGAGIAQGVIAPVVGAASGLIQTTTPMVKDIANSGMGVAFGAAAAGSFGGQMSPDGLAAVMDGVNSGKTAGKGSSETESGDGLTAPMKGLSKFFCYYKLKEGMLILNEKGEKQLDWMKISIHSAGAGLLVWGAIKVFGKKKRRY